VNRVRWGRRVDGAAGLPLGPVVGGELVLVCSLWEEFFSLERAYVHGKAFVSTYAMIPCDRLLVF
jgi:hypothetical protein